VPLTVEYNVVLTSFLICKKKKPLDVQEDSSVCEFLIAITAGLEMRWNRKIADFTIEFNDSTVGGCFSPECVDHDVM
jgi:hypothetical protein